MPVPYSEVPARIKRSVELSEKIEASGVSLRRKGKEWLGLCPFHDDKSPSFSVNDEKGLYYCRSCQATGDIITFHSTFFGVPVGDAIKQMASELDIVVEPFASPERRRYRAKQSTQVPASWADKTLHQFNSSAFLVFREQALQSSEFAVAIQSRHISDEMAAMYGLGYLPRGKSIVDLMRCRKELAGFSEGQVRSGCRALGLIENHSDESPFKDRILFPITDSSGAVVGFSGRSLIESDTPKYRNSVASQVFDKSDILYGLTPIRELAASYPNVRQQWQYLQKLDEIYLVEGYTDVIALAERGCFAVAAMGTGLSKRQVKLLLRAAKKVICLYDGDRAGREASERSMLAVFPSLTDAHRLFSLGLPQDHDPDSFLRANPDSDIPGLFSTLSRVQPESVWWAHYVGRVSRPVSLCDQVIIERAWATKESYPQSSLWRLMLSRRIQYVAGYQLREVVQPSGLPPWYGVKLKSDGRPVTDPIMQQWFAYLSHHPDLMLDLATPYLRRWWVQDSLCGRLSEGVPDGLMMFFGAVWCLSSDRDFQSSAILPALIDRGFPAPWLKAWIRTGMPDTGSADDLTFQWSAWIEALDESLSNRFLHAVALVRDISDAS